MALDKASTQQCNNRCIAFLVMNNETATLTTPTYVIQRERGDIRAFTSPKPINQRKCVREHLLRTHFDVYEWNKMIVDLTSSKTSLTYIYTHH